MRNLFFYKRLTFVYKNDKIHSCKIIINSYGKNSISMPGAVS